MKIEIWSDFACPFCYVGKKRFENALEKFEHKDQVEVIYKSFMLNPNSPLETDLSAHESLAKMKGIPVAQAKMLNERVGGMAKEVGLNFNFAEMQQTNTKSAHRVLQFANTKGLGKEMKEKFFETYFIDGKNIADPLVLVEQAKKIGLNPNEVREIIEFDRFENEVDEDINDARMLGVQGVPTFVIDRKVGVSGAQKEEYFLEFLRSNFKEESPKINIDSDSDACGPDGCDI